MSGAFCISIDVELAWGVWDMPTPQYFRLCADKERDIVRRLLTLFEQYDVSATWAIVGHLLDRSGPVPVSSPEGERIWYAPDVVEAIGSATPVQEIGSHSFAHIYCQHVSRDAMRDDLEIARAVHAKHGLEFTSFVFPRNQASHLDLLALAGLRVFRSEDAGWHTAVRRPAGRVAGRVANLADKMVPLPPATVRPALGDDGVTELPGSMLLLARSGMRRLARPEVMEAKAKLGLRAACRSGRTFHLWFHPSNFYYDTDTQFRVLEGVLRSAARARDLGTLEIRPMRSFANPGAAACGLH